MHYLCRQLVNFGLPLTPFRARPASGCEARSLTNQSRQSDQASRGNPALYARSRYPSTSSNDWQVWTFERRHHARVDAPDARCSPAPRHRGTRTAPLGRRPVWVIRTRSLAPSPR